MGRKLSVFALGLMVLAVGLLANPARAAVPGMGVVIAVDAARMSGIIIVTTLGDAVHPHPTLGEEVPFLAAPEPLAVGDLVEFDYDPTGVVAIPLKKISSGVVITGLHDGKVEATAATPMLITGATISGKITVNGGILVIIGSSVVDGKVDIDNGSTVIIVKTGSVAPKINGKVDSLTKNLVFIRGAEIEGKVTSNQDHYVDIQNAVIGGKLELLSKPANGCNVSNNTVTGKVSVPAECVR